MSSSPEYLANSAEIALFYLFIFVIHIHARLSHGTANLKAASHTGRCADSHCTGELGSCSGIRNASHNNEISCPSHPLANIGIITFIFMYFKHLSHDLR